MLEYLGGLHVEHMQAEHRRELDNWQQKYQQSNEARETSIDSIARGMAELASISGAPADTVIPVTLDSKISSTDTAAATDTGPKAAATGAETAGGDLVAIPEADMVKCTNCKTCYQDLSELFEKTKIMVGGSAKEVGRVIPGVLDHIEITPDLVQRASRVADDCDAEIIRFSEPA